MELNVALGVVAKNWVHRSAVAVMIPCTVVNHASRPIGDYIRRFVLSGSKLAGRCLKQQQHQLKPQPQQQKMKLSHLDFC